jgi:uncharacterized protein (TIGR02996 family)
MSADAFLRDIREHPDDDAVRLIYADWLEEHARSDADRARAEFIRVQCRLAAGVTHVAERLALEVRERRLLSRHRAGWLAPLAGLVRHAEFRRGFVESVRVRIETFLERGADLFAAEPVRDVVLTGRLSPPRVARLAGAPPLGHVRRLGLGPVGERAAARALDYGLRAPVLAGLLGSPFLARLTGLELGLVWVGDAQVRALAASPVAPRLERLAFHACLLVNRALAALAGGRFERLRTLDLWGSDPGAGGLHALGAAASPPELTALRLEDRGRPSAAPSLAGSRLLRGLTDLEAHTDSGDTWAEALSALPRPARLERLCLDGRGLTAAGFAALARSPLAGRLVELTVNHAYRGGDRTVALPRPLAFPKLRRLTLAGLGLGEAGAVALARSARMPRLEELDLTFNHLGSGAARALAGGTFPALTVLSLANNPLGPKGVTLLATSRGFPRLRVLDLRTSNAGDGVRALADSDLLARLVALRLPANDLDDGVVAALAASTRTAGLLELDLRWNARLTNAAALALAESPALGSLAVLELSGTGIGARGRRALAERFGPDVVRF